MSVEVRLAEHGDAGVAGRVFAEGFADDPVMTWAFGEAGQVDKLLALFGFITREATIALGATWLGGAVSCASWTPPGSPPWPPEREEAFLAVLQAMCGPDELDRFGELNRLMDAHRPGEPHWYLGAIATIPAERGKGLGAALLAAGLDVVDRDGLPAYLESSNPRNVALYERHRFEVVEVVELPDGPPLTLMWRPAR